MSPSDKTPKRFGPGRPEIKGYLLRVRMPFALAERVRAEIPYLTEAMPWGARISTAAAVRILLHLATEYAARARAASGDQGTP